MCGQSGFFIIQFGKKTNNNPSHLVFNGYSVFFWARHCSIFVFKKTRHTIYLFYEFFKIIIRYWFCYFTNVVWLNHANISTKKKNNKKNHNDHLQTVVFHARSPGAAKNSVQKNITLRYTFFRQKTI